MMRMLKYLLEKEFKQIRRDRFLPRIIFLLPVIQLVVLPFAANFEMRNINLSIVDNDHTVLSRRLTDKVLSSGYFRLADVSPRYDEALVSIESNAADIILEIPSRFEERLEREGTAELLIAANAVNGTKGGIGSSYRVHHPGFQSGEGALVRIGRRGRNPCHKPVQSASEL